MESTRGWSWRRSSALAGVRAESFLRLKSVTKPGTRRSRAESFLQLKSVTEAGSRRSPGGVLLKVEVGDGARLP